MPVIKPSNPLRCTQPLNLLHYTNSVFYSLRKIRLLFFHLPFSGTGSYPTLPKGLHRKTLHPVSTTPFALPCKLIASIAYSEQVGVKRQLVPRCGEIFSLYCFNKNSSNFFIINQTVSISLKPSLTSCFRMIFSTS